MMFHNGAMASVWVGDCLESLRKLPDNSINCCVTSPPYFGLRDYGHEGQVGLEETPEQFIAVLVAIFAEVRRVLTEDGTCWINIGDSYATGTTAARVQGKRGLGAATQKAQDAVPRIGTPEGCKTKDLIGVPWMLAFALRAEGWYLRQEIIWSKPNPMPESVRDRCTKSHEQLFLLTKSPRYFYDHEAIKEPCSENEISAQRRKRADFSSVGAKAIQGDGFGQSGKGLNSNARGETKNKRSVWSVAPRPYAGAHFAVYPPELIEPCILAGCPVGGTVLDPFGGSGTTAGVALAHGRNALLLELNPEYAALMPARVKYITDRIKSIDAAVI